MSLTTWHTIATDVQNAVVAAALSLICLLSYWAQCAAGLQTTGTCTAMQCQAVTAVSHHYFNAVSVLHAKLGLAGSKLGYAKTNATARLSKPPPMNDDHCMSSGRHQCAGS
jgi:hypothetical protein